MNADEDGYGAGAGTRMEMGAKEGKQDGNGDGSEDGAGTGTGAGWRPVDEHRMETGTGAGTGTRAVAQVGRGTRIGTGTGIRTGSGRAEKRRRNARNHTRVVDMIKHFHSACVIISADRVWRLRAPDSSVRKARCLYTHTRSEGREGANGVGGGFRVGGGNRDGNGVEVGTGTSTVMGTGTEREQT